MAGNNMGMGDGGYASFADELDATEPVGFVNCDLVNSDASFFHPIGVAINAFTGECDTHEAQEGENGPEAHAVEPFTVGPDVGSPIDLDQPAAPDPFDLQHNEPQVQPPAFRAPTFNF